MNGKGLQAPEYVEQSRNKSSMSKYRSLEMHGWMSHPWVHGSGHFRIFYMAESGIILIWHFAMTGQAIYSLHIPYISLCWKLDWTSSSPTSISMTDAKVVQSETGYEYIPCGWPCTVFASSNSTTPEVAETRHSMT